MLRGACWWAPRSASARSRRMPAGASRSWASTTRPSSSDAPRPPENDMSQSSERIAPNRYRESFGRYYEDFTVGDTYEHRPGRTITEADNVWFTLLTLSLIHI